MRVASVRVASNAVVVVFLVSVSAVLLAAPGVHAQATYVYAGNNFDTVFGGYTTAMNITGSFSIADQLPPNLPRGTDISGQVVSYSFNDGVQTLTDLNSYIVQFTVGTDASCNIVEWAITVWQGGNPVSAIDIVYSEVTPAMSQDSGIIDADCDSVSGDGRCIANNINSGTASDYGLLNSTAPAPPTPGTWSGPSCGVQAAAPVPGLGGWGIFLLIGSLGCAGFWLLIGRIR